MGNPIKSTLLNWASRLGPESLVNWADSFRNPTGAGNALLDGTPKDPTYEHTTPFFPDGKGKPRPSLNLPTQVEPHPKPPTPK